MHAHTEQPRSRCPVCGDANRILFHTVKKVPVNSVLNVGTRAEALSFPRGDIELAVCDGCGFVGNRAFDPGLVSYEAGYEATQAYSPTFSRYARRQAQMLIDRLSLRNATVLEIGCGSGEFLELLCALGNNHGIGYDPAAIPDRVVPALRDRIRLVSRPYHRGVDTSGAALILCRMTLEHIRDVGEFLSMVRQTMSDSRQQVFFQVPNATRVFDRCAFEDIYYEHCSYFDEGSLRHLFEVCGFEVLATEIAYDDQYLMIQAQACGRGREPCGAVPTAARMGALVAGFEQRFQEKRTRWRRRLQRVREAGKRGVVWGAGSKAVAFLTTIMPGEEIVAAVDINPHRWGTFLAGTGHEIVSPRALKQVCPDFVIVMNAVYRAEVVDALGNADISARVFTIHSSVGEGA